MVRTHTLVVISVRPWLEVQGLSLGPGLVKWVSCRIGVSFMHTVVMCMLVIVAPPIAIIGAWSMAFLLRQHVAVLSLS